MPNHDNNKNWIKLYRSLLDDPIWIEEPFTKGQAWVDILLRANHSPSQKIEGPNCTTIQRGQLPTSIKALADRWHWSEKKVRNFLDALTRAGNISTKRSAEGTTLTVENYAFYQNQGHAKEAQKNLSGSAKEAPSADTIRRNKERKEGKEYISAPSGPSRRERPSQQTDISKLMQQIGDHTHDAVRSD